MYVLLLCTQHMFSTVYMYCIPKYEVLLSIHVPLYVVLLSIYYICTVCIIVAYTYTVPMYVQYVLS